MTEEDIKRIQETIIKTVNGKIDSLHEKVDAHNERHEEDMLEVKEHIKKVEPILEAYTGAGALGSFMKWLSGVVVSFSILWLAIKGLFPFK